MRTSTNPAVFFKNIFDFASLCTSFTLVLINDKKGDRQEYLMDLISALIFTPNRTKEETALDSSVLERLKNEVKELQEN